MENANRLATDYDLIRQSIQHHVVRLAVVCKPPPTTALIENSSSAISFCNKCVHNHSLLFRSQNEGLGQVFAPSFVSLSYFCSQAGNLLHELGLAIALNTLPFAYSRTTTYVLIVKLSHTSFEYIMFHLLLPLEDTNFLRP